MTVAECDYEVIIEEEFWPRGSIVRDWLTREEYGKMEGGNNDMYE